MRPFDVEEISDSIRIMRHGKTIGIYYIRTEKIKKFRLIVIKSTMC